MWLRKHRKLIMPVMNFVDFLKSLGRVVYSNPSLQFGLISLYWQHPPRIDSGTLMTNFCRKVTSP